MLNANKTTGNRFATILIVISLSIALFSCQKEACIPNQAQVVNTKPTSAASANQQPLLQASTSNLQLLQANADRMAISLNWGAFQAGSDETNDYRVEASMAGTQFTNWVEIGSTNQLAINFTAKDFNSQIRKLFVTGFAEDVVIRVKCNRKNADPIYSLGASLQVTTYQPVIDYDNSQVFRVPGNYENWKVDQAPKIVSPKKDGEYEGYVNFSIDDCQFLMVKTDASWNPLTTYYNIGAGKFGFSGNMLSTKNGAGVYKFNASTSSNTWSCTKINSWSVMGTAITADGNSDVEMVRNPNNMTWQISGSFKEGSFIFRANKSNDIVFGHNTNSEIGVPDYNGSKITISKAGNYFIELSLSSAGNYSYSIQRNS